MAPGGPPTRGLCTRLDELARNPSDHRPPPPERQGSIQGLVSALAEGADLRALYARTEGRHAVFERAPQVLALLERTRRVVSLLTTVTPGWLQFVRLFERGAPFLTDATVESYLGGLEGELRQAAALLTTSAEPVTPGAPTRSSRAMG